MSFKLTFNQSEQITNEIIADITDKVDNDKTPRGEYSRLLCGLILFSFILVFLLFLPFVDTEYLGDMIGVSYVFAAIMGCSFFIYIVLFVIGLIVNTWISEYIIEKVFIISLFMEILVYGLFWFINLSKKYFDSVLILSTIGLLNFVVVCAALLQSFIEYRKFRKIQNGIIISEEKNELLESITEKTIDVGSKCEDDEKIESLKDVIGLLAFSQDDELSKYHNFILSKLVPPLIIIAFIAIIPTLLSFKVNIVSTVGGICMYTIIVPIISYYVVYLIFAYGPFQEIIPIYYLNKYQKEYSEKYKINLGRRKNGK